MDLSDRAKLRRQHDAQTLLSSRSKDTSQNRADPVNGHEVTGLHSPRTCRYLRGTSWITHERQREVTHHCLANGSPLIDGSESVQSNSILRSTCQEASQTITADDAFVLSPPFVVRPRSSPQDQRKKLEIRDIPTRLTCKIKRMPAPEH